MASVRLIALLILTLTNAAADTSLAPQQHDCGGLRGDGSCAATTTSVCRNSRGEWVPAARRGVGAPRDLWLVHTSEAIKPSKHEGAARTCDSHAGPR